MGSVYTIEVPSGHQLKIEADSPDAALSAANGWHAENSAKPPATLKDTAVDTYKGLDAGVAGGTATLLGLPGDLTNAAAKGIGAGSDWLSEKLGLPKYEPPSTPGPVASFLQKNIPTSESMSKEIQNRYYGGEKPYEPTGEGGKYGKSIGEFLPGAVAAAATGGGTLAGNAIRYAVAPGVATQAAEENLPETSWKPYQKAAIGVAASLPNPARLVTPIPSTAAKQAAVATLADEGVTSLTAGQRTGNKSLQYIEDAASSAPMAGGGASRIEAEGQRQFTEAALRRAGAAGEATPEVLAANQARLGHSFNDLAARNNLVPDNHFVNDIVDAARNYRRVPDSQQRQMVQGYIDDIVGHVNNGHMPGPQYQEMRSRLSTQSNALRGSDPTLSQALRDMRNALDSAMGRSIAPEDQALWQTTRREYAAQKLIEKAASRAGEATLEGQITPPNLRNAIPKQGGGYARGEGQFDELARAGASVMTPLPNSGTAQRTNAFNILNNLLLGIPQAAAGRAIMSPPVQAYLSNQLMNGALPNSPEARRLLMIELLKKSQQPTQQTQ